MELEELELFMLEVVVGYCDLICTSDWASRELWFLSAIDLELVVGFNEKWASVGFRLCNSDWVMFDSMWFSEKN